MTVNIMTVSIMTVSITTLSMTPLLIMTLSMTALSKTTLASRVAMQSGITFVIMLNDVILNVVAPLASRTLPTLVFLSYK